MTNKKCSFVTIVGAPNAGKSTLLNQLIGQKISIVTPKEQTTRECVRGISVHGNTQIVYIDTPGLFKPKRTLEKNIVKAAWAGVKGADVSVFLIDVKKGINDNISQIIGDVSKRIGRNILVLNKIDAINKSKLLPLIEKINNIADFERIFMVSALNGDGVDELTEHLVTTASDDQWAYPEEQMTDISSRNLASEITREKLMLHLNNELPYNIIVETEKWEENTDGKIIINQVIYTISDSHKKIIVGKQGAGIKEIGQRARHELEKIFQTNVNLFLFVKVKEKIF